MSTELRMPSPVCAGVFVPTLNGLGFMSTRRDDCMEAFLSFAETSPAPVADIGAAYGVATIPALETGASVVAVDLDARHLAILKQRVPQPCRRRLLTMTASFPEGLQLDRDSIGAFLISNVLNFLSPERLQLAAARLFDWLVAGGKVFVSAGTPYLGLCKRFVPLYEARKRDGDPWAGNLTDVPHYAPDWKNVPSLLLLDPDTLCRVFGEAGFVIEKAGFMPRPDLPRPVQLDGRESVGIIAGKPAVVNAR